MAAEVVDGNEADSDKGSKVSLKRSLDDHIEDSSSFLEGGYQSPKRPKMDDHRCCDGNIPLVCDSSIINLREPEADENNEKEKEDGLYDEELDENLLNEIGSLFDLRSSSAIAAMMWIERRMGSGDDPRSILKNMSVDEKEIPADLDDATLWKLIASCVADPPRRNRLDNVSTYADVVDLIKKSSRIIVLTGAGVSVSCGIPDFRSRNGIYARLSVDYPDLPDPQAMFDIGYFKKNPKPFFKFAKEIYPGKFDPSVSHFFIGALEKAGKLLRNYTQNIDTLEPSAGIARIIQCHGSFSTATCMSCKYKVDADAIREDVMNQVIPRCPQCPPDSEFSILKPDIVFFGESLPEEFQQFELDKEECDLLMVMGSSLIVRPVAIIPNVVPSHVPQVLINREPLPHMNFDVELLGDCDVIVQRLCSDLGEPYLNVLNHLKETSGGNSEVDSEVETNALSLDDPTPSACQSPGECLGKSDEAEQKDFDSRDACKETWGKEATEAQTHPDSSTSPEVENDRSEEPSHEGCSASDVDDSRSSKAKKLLDVTELLDGREYMCLVDRRYVFKGAEISEKDKVFSSVSDWESGDDSDDDDDDAEVEEEEEEEEEGASEDSIRNTDDRESESNEVTDTQEGPSCLNGDSPC